MAQSDFAEKLEIDGVQIEYTDVMTGDKNRNRFLYYQLKMSMLKANKIDIIVSFLMESGVRMILKDLKAALDRGVQVRILTGNYLGITLFVLGIVIVSVIYSILKIVFFPAKVISKLPVVSSADKLLGVLIGIAETLLVYWTMCCLFMYLDLGVLEEQLMDMIKESALLTGVYKYNLLGVILDTLKDKLY